MKVKVKPLKYEVEIENSGRDKSFSMTLPGTYTWVYESPVDIEVDDIVIRECVMTNISIDHKAYQYELPGQLSTDSRTFSLQEGCSETSLRGTFQSIDKLVSVKFKDKKTKVWWEDYKIVKQSLHKEDMTYEEYQRQLMVERL